MRCNSLLQFINQRKNNEVLKKPFSMFHKDLKNKCLTISLQNWNEKCWRTKQFIIKTHYNKIIYTNEVSSFAEFVFFFIDSTNWYPCGEHNLFIKRFRE